MIESVLIIEDDVNICRALERFLGDRGVVVTTRCTHREALITITEKLADSFLFDLVILDGWLDGRRNSLDLIDGLKKISGHIVAVSGDETMRSRQLELGCTDAVGKSDLLDYLSEKGL